MKLQDFIDSLHGAKWKAVGDAQHAQIRELWARLYPDAAQADRDISDMQDALDALEARNKVLEEALRAIIERWDTPNWKDAEHTGAVINRARAALEGK